MFSLAVSFLVLICVIKCSNSFSSEALRNDLILSESFFDKLSRDYGAILPSKDVTEELEEKISEFVETLQSPVRWRQRRHLDGHKRGASGGEKICEK